MGISQESHIIDPLGSQDRLRLSNIFFLIMQLQSVHDTLERQSSSTTVSRKKVFLPEAVGVLQKPQRRLHIADVIWVFDIAQFVRIRVLRVLWVIRMSTESVANRCEAGYA